jgi:hypothetical protein
MPDMSAADLAALLGTFLAAIITGLGLRRGEAEKRDLPAADPSLSAGVFVGLDAETQRAILDEIRDLHADLADWRRQDDIRRRAEAERETDQRFEQIETDQAKMLRLLRRMDAVADAAREDEL